MMQSAAGFLVRELGMPKGSQETKVRQVLRESGGDLVGMLDLPGDAQIYSRESQSIAQIIDPETGELLESDPDSPFVILGDSFVNVYEDPSLGFGMPDEERIGAGFASHLVAETGHRFHVIAMNGDGASGVRKAFASLSADVVAKKEKVIWILSARDLLLSEIPGRRAGIEWESVEFNTHSATKEESPPSIDVTGVLRDRSIVGDPRQTPYDSAVYSVLLDELNIGDGANAAEEVYVFLWAFRDRQLEETANLELGRRYQMTLIPFPSSGAVSRTTQLDDLFRSDLPRYFAESIELIK
jgi:hypothetical protein